ncbi:MAG TPA: PEP-CTERM sorting domain-containing protein [Vicinamibacterales bacterium]|jgi:hypothetical protein|nr:PEP-CTERM sorting domain-containing protein [Vicinamibacterales bacterium]
MRDTLRTLGFWLMAAFVLAVATPSRAAVITFSSSAAWEAAVTSFDTWDFNGPEGNQVILLNSLGTNIVSVATQGGDPQGLIHDSALCGSTGGGVDCFKPIELTFLEPRNAFGFDNLDFNGFEEAVVQLAFSGGGTQTFVFDLGGAPAFTPIFFGVISDQNLASATIYSRDPGSDTIGQRANVIDNVRVGIAEVPEPGVIALLATGLGGMLLRRRRRT